MRDREVISNTSPLLYLHQVGQLDLLHKLYGKVIVPRPQVPPNGGGARPYHLS